MNKYTMAEVKVGDYFIHLEDKGVYKLIGLIESKYRGDISIDYTFLEMRTNETWTYGKKWFMKKLMPAPRAARILYEPDDASR